MKLRIDSVSRKQSVLIVSKKKGLLTELIKTQVEKYEAEIFFSSRAPEDLSRFDYCFFINENIPVNKIRNLEFKKLAFIFINQEKNAVNLTKHKLKGIKIINITGDITASEQADKILWFSLSQTNEFYLRMILPRFVRKDKIKHVKRSINYLHFINKKRVAGLIVLAILIIHFGFILPLAFSSYSLYRASIFIKSEKIDEAENLVSGNKKLLSLSKSLYSVSRPTLLMFSLALMPDNIIEINEKAQETIEQSIKILRNTKESFSLILKNDKSKEDKDVLQLRINQLTKDLSNIGNNLYAINQKLPNNIGYFNKTKKDLSNISEIIIRFQRLLPYMDNIMAKGGEKKYLLLFANNKELRPGGGFIGSFGILTINDYTLKEIKIYDVYDADGQLVAHIEPPLPIRTILKQPHWFLRDSAFSPDFLENYSQAKYFLEKEMGMKDFSGAFLITTSAIENIIGAFGDIYVPDFKETINQKNFYLKTQIHSEKDFFPGSTQKKNFLASLTRQIMINLDSVSPKQLAFELNKSLDEKQIVLYFDNTKTQDIIDSFYWSGRVIDAQCPAGSTNCIVDYLFPYDANLGVNKANFYVSRSISLTMDVGLDGSINHTATIKIKNDSPGEVFPVGAYHDYFQMLIPRDSMVKNITKNDTLVENYNEENGQFKKIGFLVEVPPKQTAEIKIDYRIPKQIEKGKGTYQFIVQKQTGSPNSDFNLEINLPQGTYLLNQNFTPLVKEGHIVYNTSISADKIFFIEFIKE